MDKQEIDAFEIYGTRLLLFMETEPQSNKYRQILPNLEEFKRISSSFGTLTGKKIEIEGCDVDELKVKLSDDIYNLPDLKEIYG